MDKLFSYLFGNFKSCFCTAFTVLVIFGIVNPEGAQIATATIWNNFWTAFGPIAGKMLEITIFLGFIWFLVRAMTSKGGGSTKKK